MDFIEIINCSNRRIAEEDLKLLERCCDWFGARTILEIGSADGGSSIVLGTKAKERGGHLYCIEPKPTSKMVGNMKHYGLENFYTIIPYPSPWIDKKYLPDELDLLFIDGCHEVRWALVDYHYFEPLVKENGIIVFHDTSGNCREDKADPDYGKPGYVPKVQRAIDIIMQTDSKKLLELDRSDAKMGGAIAFIKGDKL